jgi:UDP-N-acetylglucosamine 1-carboxyvinyltransferase
MSMIDDLIVSQGPVTLKGDVHVSGSKNASLPLLAASLLCKERVTFKNLPHLVDIGILVGLLSSLGTEATWINNGITLKHERNKELEINPGMANKIRGSLLLLGPLLARYGHVILPMPGGCPIGKRPIDFHLQALEKLGATFIIKDDQVHAFARNGLKGTKICFPKPTVTGTENIIMAACLARGNTIIENAACDNEVDELIRFLKSAGAMIERNQTTITIEGSDDLLIAKEPFTIVADRMEAGSLLAACGITKGTISLHYESCPGLEIILKHLTEMGMTISSTPTGITATAYQGLKAKSFITEPHPGFPTDLQAPFMALNCISEGLSTIEERIWENRFFHADEFLKMGARLNIKDNKVYCDGGSEPHGAIVQAQDLRGSCAILLLSLAAHGTTILHNNHHLDRGYAFFINKLNMLGGSISRGYFTSKDLNNVEIKYSSLVA